MLDAKQIDLASVVSYLEHYPESGQGAHRLLLDHFPFSIGRSPSANYCIDSRQVSKEHALIFRNGENICIQDQGSMNGTFVNGERVREINLRDGDIVHIGPKEFRFSQTHSVPQDLELLLTDHLSGPPIASAIRDVEFLKDLLRMQSVRTCFQPIVDLRTQAVVGHEALGRGTHGKLSSSPIALLNVASKFNLASALSQLMRCQAMQDATLLSPEEWLFLNVDPSEFRDGTLFRSLNGICESNTEKRSIVLEIHEEAITDLNVMRRLRDHLHFLGIQLAYDDFGTGRSRLTELADVPPDFLKLDKSLIRGLHLAGARQELVRALTKIASGLGIRVIAEGIELAEEAEISLSLGCHYGQGFYFGRPRSVTPPTLAENGTEETNSGL